MSGERELLFNTLNALCALAFFGYGTSCLLSARMVTEFERYRLARFRSLTGWLQLLAAAGLIAGFVEPLAGLIAASGLAVQMLLGLGVRLRIGDGPLRSFPALFFLCVNAWLAAGYLRMVAAG